MKKIVLADMRIGTKIYIIRGQRVMLDKGLNMHTVMHILNVWKKSGYGNRAL